MKTIIDSNTIIKYLVADNKILHEKAKTFFAGVRNGTTKIFLEQIVFAEVVDLLSSRYNVPREKINETLCYLIKYRGINCEDKAIFLKALEIYTSSEFNISDALLLAKANILNYQVFSFNDKFLDYYEQFSNN